MTLQSNRIFTVADVADILHLQAERNGGKLEYHGPNPTGLGAQEDGYILFPDGNAHDRKLGVNYTSIEVAQQAEIDPATFEPVIQYRQTHPQLNGNGYHNGYQNGNGVRGILDEESDPEQLKKLLAQDDSVEDTSSGQEEIKTERKVDTRTLEERGIREGTFSFFHIKKTEESYKYPTFMPDQADGRSREKFFDPVAAGQKYTKNGKPMKCRWVPNDSDPEPVIYNLNNLKHGTEEVFLVGGEVDVWSCWQAGIPAVSGFGEGRKIDKIIDEIKRFGSIGTVYVTLDNDEAGHRAAFKAAELLAKKGISPIVKEIMLFDKADVNDLYESVGYDDEKLRQAIVALPTVSPDKLKKWSGEIIDEVSQPAPKKKATPADPEKGSRGKLLSLLSNYKMFIGQDKQFYATIPMPDGTIRTFPCEDSDFNAIVCHLYGEVFGTNVDSDDVKNVVHRIRGRVLSNNIKDHIWIRSGFDHHTGHVFIDLCDDARRKIEIGADIENGWRIVSNAPVPFNHPKSLDPLPLPKRYSQSHLDQFRELINAEDDDNWILMIAWMIYALMPPERPKPVLVINGAQGSAKSTISRILRTTIDPDYTPLISSAVNDERELAITAHNSYVLAFDNVSYLSKRISDALSQLVTDGCFRCRKLHSDRDQILFRAIRPILLNGIEDSYGREDFQNRCMNVKLPAVLGDRRDTEEEIEATTKHLQPYILALIMDAIASILANKPNVQLDFKPRMADFYKGIVAACPALPFSADQFKDAYLSNQTSIQSQAIDNNPFAAELVAYIEANQFLEGTPTEVFNKLERFAKPESKFCKDWPGAYNKLSHSLNRVADNLRNVNFIEVQSGRGGKKGDRFIKIRKMAREEIEHITRQRMNSIEQQTKITD